MAGAAEPAVYPPIEIPECPPGVEMRVFLEGLREKLADDIHLHTRLEIFVAGLGALMAGKEVDGKYHLAQVVLQSSLYPEFPGVAREHAVNLIHKMLPSAATEVARRCLVDGVCWMYKAFVRPDVSRLPAFEALVAVIHTGVESEKEQVALVRHAAQYFEFHQMDFDQLAYLTEQEKKNLKKYFASSCA